MGEERRLAFGDENPIAKAIREALGVGDFDDVLVQTPQFERTDGKTITYIPKTKEEFDALKTAPLEVLKDIGMGNWDGKLWLFPKEWYDHIPNAYEIVDINGGVEEFVSGETDDDIRFGFLAYGILREETKES